MQELSPPAAEPARLTSTVSTVSTILGHATAVGVCASAIAFALCIAFVGDTQSMAVAFHAAALSTAATLVAGITYLIIRPQPAERVPAAGSGHPGPAGIALGHTATTTTTTTGGTGVAIDAGTPGPSQAAAQLPAPARRLALPGR